MNVRFRVQSGRAADMARTARCSHLRARYTAASFPISVEVARMNPGLADSVEGLYSFEHSPLLRLGIDQRVHSNWLGDSFEGVTSQVFGGNAVGKRKLIKQVAGNHVAHTKLL